jgi:RimJ/RimL family protein N-acetyltransferase
MARAALFVGSGGSIGWERACLGLPGITVSLAQNQTPLCEALAEAGGDLHVGSWATSAELLRRQLAAALVALTLDAAWRSGAARRLRELCDGRGAERVARALLEPAISLRPAVPADAVRVFPWRNDPRTRALFFDPSPLLWDSHCAWFENALTDPRRRLLIGMNEGADVGVVRFDLDEDGAELSVYLDPDAHGQGLGPALIDAACEWFETNEDPKYHVHARIRSQNAASLAAFAAAGFTEVERVFARALAPPNKKATT